MCYRSGEAYNNITNAVDIENVDFEIYAYNVCIILYYNTNNMYILFVPIVCVILLYRNRIKYVYTNIYVFARGHWLLGIERGE